MKSTIQIDFTSIIEMSDLESKYYHVNKFKIPDIDDQFDKAFTERNYEGMKDCLSKGANINSMLDTSPLHIAIANNDHKLAIFLLQNGADPNLSFDGLNTPLRVAAINNRKEMVKILIKYGADPNLKDHNGITTLQSLVMHNQKQMVTFLLKNGANPNLCSDTFFYSPLHSAITYSSNKMVRILLKNGAEPNLKGYHDETQLFYAVQNNKKNIVRTLLHYGADPNLKNDYEYTALYDAFLYNSPNIFKILLKAGAETNYKLKNGSTVLHEICRANNLELAKLLIQHGAKVDVTDRDGMNPIDCIPDQQNKKLLLEYVEKQKERLKHVDAICFWLAVLQLGKQNNTYLPKELLQYIHSFLPEAYQPKELEKQKFFKKVTDINSKLESGFYKTKLPLFGHRKYSAMNISMENHKKEKTEKRL